MKKLVLLGVLAALGVACASTGSTSTATTANQPMTLDEALQKSAETRQKLQDAKQAYQSAREASAAAEASNSITDQVKEQIKQKAATTKNQVDSEVKAWQDVLK